MDSSRSRSRCIMATGVLLSATMAVVGQVGASSSGLAATGAQESAQQAGPTRALGFEHVDFFSGAIRGVAVDGSTGYISRGVHVEALDFSDPLAPRLVGRSAPLPGLARVVAADDGRAYLVEAVRHADKSGLDRLYVLDVTDRSAPVLRSSLDLPRNGLSDVAVADGYLYSAAGSAGLIVLDVHDAGQPRQVATVTTDKPANAVALASGQLLVAVGSRADDGGLRLFDRTDPAAPQLAGAFDIGQEADAVARAGDYALVGTWENVFVIDVADPGQLRLVSQLRAYGGRAFAVTGPYAYLLRATGGVRERPQLALLDVSLLPEIRNLGELPLWSAFGLAALGQQALVADGAIGLRLVGPVAQGAGAPVERYREPTIGDPGGVVVDGSLAYVSDWDGELWALDVTDRSAPRVVGRTDLPMPGPLGGSVEPGAAGLAVRGGYAYIARTGHWTSPGGLHVVDVSVPASPRQVASWLAEDQLSPVAEEVVPNGYAPVLDGDRLFLTGIPLLAELDIADPAAPRLRRTAELAYPPNWGPSLPKTGGIAVGGEVAWVAEPVMGLQLLDLLDGQSIRPIADLDTPGDASDVATSGGYALLADGPKGLRVIDSGTLAPVRSIEDKSAVRIRISGDTAFLVGYLPDTNYEAWPYAMRVWAVDVADPTLPVVRGEYVEPYGDDDPPPDTADAGDTLYVAAASAGLDIVHLVDGQVLPVPTTGPTLTPIPTPDWRTPTATEKPVVPLPSPTSGPTTTVEARTPTRPTANRVFLPAAFKPSTAGQAPGTPTASATAPTATPFPTPTLGTPDASTPTPTTPVVPPSILIASGEVSEPDVAGDAERSDCQHLVVWREDAGAGAIRGRFVRPDGAGEPFLISAEAGAAGPPATAYSASRQRWLVVWAAPDPQTVSAIRGRVIGCPAAEGPVIEVGRYWLIEDEPAVAADGDGFAVVWRRSFSGRPDLQLVGVRVDGPTVPEPQGLADPGQIAEPAIACEGTGRCLVTWAQSQADERDTDVLARAWSPRAGTLGSETLAIADTDLPERSPTIAWGGAGEAPAYVVAWTAELRYAEVRARTILPAGPDRPDEYALGSPPIEVSMTLGGSFTPDVVALASGFGAVFAMGPPVRPAPDVAALRLTLAPDGGALLLGRRTTMSEDDVWSRQPALACGHDPEVLAVWSDQLGDGSSRIVGRYAALATSN